MADDVSPETSRRERLAHARDVLLRALAEHPVVTPELFERVEEEAHIDQEDLAALLGELMRLGLISHHGLGFSVSGDEKAHLELLSALA